MEGCPPLANSSYQNRFGNSAVVLLVVITFTGITWERLEEMTKFIIRIDSVQLASFTSWSLTTEDTGIVTQHHLHKRRQKNCDGFSLQKWHGPRRWYISSDIWNVFSLYEIRGFVSLPRSSFFLDKHPYANCIHKVRVKAEKDMMQTLGLCILQHCRNPSLR